MLSHKMCFWIIIFSSPVFSFSLIFILSTGADFDDLDCCRSSLVPSSIPSIVFGGAGVLYLCCANFICWFRDRNYNFIYFFDSSFMTYNSTFHTIHPFKVYRSVVFKCERYVTITTIRQNIFLIPKRNHMPLSYQSPITNPLTPYP